MGKMKMINIMLEEFKTDLIRHAIWTNDNADRADINRNYTDYGAVTAYAAVFRKFGTSVDIQVYKDRGCLKFSKIIIGKNIIQF